MTSPPVGSPPGHASIQGQGSTAANTVQPSGPTVYLRLRFKDAENPAGDPRDFPKGLPVRVRFTDGSAKREENFTLGANGVLRFPEVRGATLPWREFTLLFPGSENEFVVCEPAGGAARTSELATAATLNTVSSPPGSPPGANKRFFRLPGQQGQPAEIWALKHSDWAPVAAVPNATFTQATGVFRHNSTTPANAPDIGSAAAPVVLVLDPHWKFFQFIFFDRLFGSPRPGSPPSPSHGRRISIPPITLEGFRATSTPPPADLFTGLSAARSNWTTAGDPKDTLQCLPWIVTRNNAGAALPDLTGTTMGLRFQTSQANRTCVFSDSLTVRRVVNLAATANELKPGPNRLKYYDLPRMWKSRRYFARGITSSPPAPGKFFQDLTQADVTVSDAKATPLIFCLDDIVLYTAAGAGGTLTPLAALPAADKVAIFNHRFDGTLPDSTQHGLFKVQDPAGAPSSLELPYSNVPTPDNYLFDYPDWTRLLATQGNLFDVFDQRAPDSPTVTRVVGARAAVRWVNATATLPGLQVWNGAAWVAAAPVAGSALSGFAPRTDVPAANPLFSIQPFYEQRDPASQSPFTGADARGGRWDMALLRCCDVDSDGDEIATNFHYIKSFFNFTYTPAPTSPPASPPPAVSRLAAGAQRQYAQNYGINVAARWNGNEAGLSTSRILFLPRVTSPPGPKTPLKTFVVMYCQSVTLARAHFNLGVVPPGGRDFREPLFGNGETAEGSAVTTFDAGVPGWFTAAHETGHMDGLPDEYNERWNGFSYAQLSFLNNMPGDPYEPDGRNELGLAPDSAMMNSNRRIRNRYLWGAAEWVRLVTNIRLRVSKTDGGTRYDDYFLPAHPQAAARQTFYSWPFRARRNANTHCDLFLYALGKDRYSQLILQTLATSPGPAPASPPLSPPSSPPGVFSFDGILIIGARLGCTLPGNLNLQTETDDRDNYLSNLAATVRLGMNYRFFATGSVGGVNFTRVLIHFAPQYLVTNYPFYGPAQSPPKPVRTVAGNSYYEDHNPAGAQTIRTNFGVNARVNLSVAAPAAAVWNAGTTTLTMNVQNTTDASTQIETNFPRLLGINKDMTAVTAADVQTIARLILPGAAVNHL